MPDRFANLRSKDDMQKRHEAMRRQAGAAAAVDARNSRAMFLAVCGLGAGLAWAVYNNNRLATKAAGKDVVFAMLNAQEGWVASTRYSDVASTTVSEGGITAALWTYIQARECYSLSAFAQQDNVALAMSDAIVGRQVHAQFTVKNPTSPQNLYGKKGIDVKCELVSPPQRSKFSNVYQFRFRRWLQDGSISDKRNAQIFMVTVTYRLGIYASDPTIAWIEKDTFNAPGVQVIDYPGAEPETAVPAREAMQ